MSHYPKDKRKFAKDLKAKYEKVPAKGTLDEMQAKGLHMIYPNKCIVEKIACKIGATGGGVIELYDGSTKVITISMKKLNKTISDMRKVDKVLGISWAKPQEKDSIKINKPFITYLAAKGDVENLVIWLDETAIK